MAFEVEIVLLRALLGQKKCGKGHTHQMPLIGGDCRNAVSPFPYYKAVSIAWRRFHIIDLSISKEVLFSYPFLTGPKSQNYGATGDATPANKAQW